ncbi:STAS domain-containing protein [Brevundimonas sp. LPMIX5]|nr:STAS domain-containing protein [Brevundimonas sp. LPMIX5]
MEFNASSTAYPITNGRTDARTFSAFGEIYARAQSSSIGPYSLDCTNLMFCNSNLAAALMAIHRQLGQTGRGLSFLNLRPRVSSILNDSGLFGVATQRPRPSVVPLTPFNHSEGDRFDLYVRRGLANKGLPDMSPGLENEFFTGIHELFTNFEIHSQSSLGAWAAGQLFPVNGRVEMTLVDAGVGIPSRIMQRGFAQSPHAAIDWAMTGSNTTRELDVPGGLGLKVLREFIRLNQGELTIASHGGFWREAGGRVDMRPLTHPFPGTAVTVVVNTQDNRSYQLAREVRPGDIF